MGTCARVLVGAAEQLYGHVKRVHVLGAGILVVEGVPVVGGLILRQHPDLVVLDEEPPEAGVEVQVDNEKENEFAQIQKLLDVFRQVQKLDDLSNFEHPPYFEKAQQPDLR